MSGSGHGPTEFYDALQKRYEADPALPVVERRMGTGGPPNVVATRRRSAMLLLLDIDEARETITAPTR